MHHCEHEREAKLCLEAFTLGIGECYRSSHVGNTPTGFMRRLTRENIEVISDESFLWASYRL